jgi:hypothetical protein
MAKRSTAFMPWGGDRVAQEVLAPERPVFAKRNAARPLPCRVVGLNRNFQAFQVFGAGAVLGNGGQLLVLCIRHPDPGHLHAAERHGVAADLREQFIRVFATHNGLVALAQCRIQLGQALVSDRNGIALFLDFSELDLGLRQPAQHAVFHARCNRDGG